MWSRGLRRYTRNVFSSEAQVQILPSSFTIFFFKFLFLSFYLVNKIKIHFLKKGKNYEKKMKKEEKQKYLEIFQEFLFVKKKVYFLN